MRCATPTLSRGLAIDRPTVDENRVDHVLSWNVNSHGDEDVVRRSIAEIALVPKPGRTFLCAVLSARRLPVEPAAVPGREIPRNTWTFEGGGDKVHPHCFCNATDLLDLFDGFNVCRLEDREHDTSGSWHWNLTMERL